nr:molybdopterin-dependent oxidoreductase [Nocardia tenerifensis]
MSKQAFDRAAAALTGILAALTVLGVGHLVAALIDPAASPFYALGAAVVDHTPHAVKDAAIRRFGSNDKLALFASMGAAMLAAAPLLGLLERRRPLGSALLVVLGGSALAAALQRPTATAWFALPTLVGVAAGVAVLRLLVGPAGPPARHQGGRARDRIGDGLSASARRPVEGYGTTAPAAGVGSIASGHGATPAASGHSETSTASDQSTRAKAGASLETPSAQVESVVGDTASAAQPVVRAPRGQFGRADDRGGGRSARGVPDGARPSGSALSARAYSESAVPVADSATGDEEITGPAGSPQQGGRSRRRFLALAAGVGAVAVGAAVAGQWIGARLRDVVGDRTRFIVPRASAEAPVAGTGVAPRVPGLSEFVTANDRFYRVDTALQLPALTSGEWRLRIHGMVDRPLELDFTALRRREPVERMITMTCVSNEVGGDLAGTAVWTGYPLAELLAEAGVRAEADMLLSRSVDGFTAGTPVAAVTDGRDALLAVGMNGEPLPIAHGYPARLIVPGLYGYVSATKWVVDLELTRFDRAKAYWTERGWAAQALVKTASRIDVPAAFATVEAGEVTVAGVAWAQHRGIDAVEVQVDDAPWQPAVLADEYSTDTWRQWTWRWPATPGTHTLRVRATDRSGMRQTDRRTPPFPDGATGWHSRVVTVR